MGLYISKYNTLAEYNAVKDNLLQPHVSHIEENDDVEYKPYHDYSQDYFTLVACEDGEFRLNNNEGVTLDYSMDNGVTWETLENGVSVSTGDKVLFKGINQEVAGSGIGVFESDGIFIAEGNIMSLLYGDDFIGQADLTGKDWAFCDLFNACEYLVSARNLILAATTLAVGCYNGMFNGCTSLTTAPELPALTVLEYCYENMFYDCTSLVTAPELPATTLAEECYYEMFNGCESLTTPPHVLPATTLVIDCYYGMFKYCESLEFVPTILATSQVNANECCCYMFYGCSSLTTIPSNLLRVVDLSSANHSYEYMFGGCTSLTTISPDFMLATTFGYCECNGMFEGCTSLTTLPSNLIKAASLSGSSECFEYMFEGCTSLTTLPSNMLPSTVLGEKCYSHMFCDCTNLTTIPSDLLPSTNLQNGNGVGAYDSMFEGCTSLTSIPSGLLPATTLANTCYISMFEGCTSLVTLPSDMLPATTLTSHCYNSMFKGCTSLTTAPVLSATTLNFYSYCEMFSGCTSLNSITCLATNISANGCTTNWVNGVANSGIFTKAENMANWPTGNNGIPTDWSVEEPHEYVDLGLPSGTLWATMNIGASSVTDYGNYYNYGKGSAQYAATSGENIYEGEEIPLNPNLDAAAQTWGSSWHMPTSAQCQELIDNTTYTWETNFNGSGKNGVKFTAQNGHYVFLPAAGYYSASGYDWGGTYGWYCSSTPYQAQYVYFIRFSNYNSEVYSQYRRYGFSVRPVRDA